MPGSPDPGGRIDVSHVMADLQARVRAELRERLIARGGPPEFADKEIFDVVEHVLRHAIESHDRKALLIPEIITEEDDWKLETALRLTSHRSVLGPVLIFAKRRLILPLIRWLYEYSLDNFRRQQRLNEIMFATLQALAIETASLQLQLEAARKLTASPATDHPSTPA